jgi:hypothetical protein
MIDQPNQINKFPVVLMMTVKNEAHIIHRCLHSTLPYIDGVAISVDSKTTDNTIEVINECVNRYNKPCKIEIKECPALPFDRVDMAFARNSAMELAESLIKEHFNTDKAYLLLMDADEKLIFNSKTPFSSLDGTSNYSFIKKYSDSYKVWSGEQLVLAFNGYYFVDEIHEYMEQKPGYFKPLTKRLDTFYLDFKTNLSARSRDSNKIYKDIATLKSMLEKRPSYRRAQYYLALAYKEAGMVKEEAETYHLLVNNPSAWIEEKYYAYIHLAFISDKDKIYYLLKAYELSKSRAEPLYYLLLHALKEGLNEFAYDIAIKALKIPKPEMGSFLLDESIYDWKLKDQAILAAYYNNDYQLSYDICFQLLQSTLLPESEVERIKSNLNFAKSKLGLL